MEFTYREIFYLHKIVTNDLKQIDTDDSNFGFVLNLKKKLSDEQMSLCESIGVTQKKPRTISDLDILNAATDPSVDLTRKEGFIQGAKWFRNQISKP